MASKKPQKLKPQKAQTPDILDTSAPRDVLSVAIDQSLSSTGIAVSIPISHVADVRALLPILYAGLSDKEYSHRMTGIEASLADCQKLESLQRLKVKNIKSYPIYTVSRWSSGPRKLKRLLLGAVVRSPEGLTLVASSRVSSEASSDAEWVTGQRNSKVVSGIVSRLAAYASERGISQINVSCESLAMGGSKLTARILPILGIVWAMMFQALDQMIIPASVRLSTHEFQISSWKKAFTANGKANKIEVSERVMVLLEGDLSLYAFETSDESDSMAMVLLLASKQACANQSTGRIRPVLGDSQPE